MDIYTMTRTKLSSKFDLFINNAKIAFLNGLNDDNNINIDIDKKFATEVSKLVGDDAFSEISKMITELYLKKILRGDM